MTIKDIARIAKVTHSTVSRSLNDSPLVSEETKERIRRIASELGYTPNALARQLATRRSQTLGLFFLSRGELDFTQNFGTQFLDGISNACHEAGYDLLLFTLPHRSPSGGSYLQLCRERRVEGVIFIGLTSVDPQLAEIRAADLPVSVIDFPLEGRQLASVGSDTRLGIELAMDHLYGQGHRRIAFIGGPEVAPIAVEREACYRDWLRAHPDCAPAQVLRGTFSKESGAACGRELAALPALPDAVLAANDLMAIGAMQALKRAGLPVPQAISIMGYDNASGTDFADPALTTVGQDPVAIGRQAVDCILDRLAARQVPPTIRIQPRLVIRDSVAPKKPHTGVSP